MDTMIRERRKSSTNLGRGSFIILAVLSLIVLASLIAGILNASSLGWQGLIFMGAVTVVGILGLMTLAKSREKSALRASVGTEEDSPLMEAFRLSPEPSLITKDGKPYLANASYLALANELGATGASGTAPTVDRLFATSGRDTASAVFRLHHMNSNTIRAEEALDTITPSGELRRYQVVASNLGTAQLWTIVDITAGEASAESTLVGAPVGLFSVDTTGRVLAVNSVLRRWLGIGAGVTPTLMREFIQNTNALLETEPSPGRVVRTDTRLITQKGIVTPTIMVATWRELSNGEPYASVALYGHSSLGVRTSAMSPSGPVVAANYSSANSSFTAAPVAILQLSGGTLSKTLIVQANPAFEAISGNAEWENETFGSLFSKKEGGYQFLRKTAAQCKADKPFSAVLDGETPMPVNVYISLDATDPNLCWVYMVDVSSRKSLEDQLVQSQKMQAIGQLAGGVAHDFNNLLTAIRLNTDDLLGRHPVGDPSYPELQKINSTVTRAAGLVKKLLAFSRKQTLRTELLEVSDTLSDVSVLLKQVLVERVKLNVIHGRDLPPIRVDKGQLETVLMNLCVNARDAMADSGGGVVTIKSSKLDPETVTDDDLSDALADIPAENFVVIEVADTGTGMSDDVKAKIFEPFFTTKEQGKGTGLGLATVYGIVQQSGGHLTVESELGVGTVFKIYLPEAAKDEQGKDVVVPAKKPEVKKPANLSGQGNILFVEDEASVRTIAAKTLRKRGYKVTEAEDGEEAYDILSDGAGPFDLLLSDVVMPGMDGPTLLKKGRHMLGDARIVFISGYAEEEFSDLLAEEPDVTFLPKPFTLAQLAEKVKAEIGESDSNKDAAE